MRTIDVQPLIDAIRNIEKTELIHALKAHDNGYDFADQPDAEPVSIEYWDGFAGPQSGTVQRVSVAYDRTLLITVNESSGHDIFVNPDEFYPGQLSLITKALPEPRKK